MLTLFLLLVPLVWCLITCWKWKKNVFDVMEKMPGLQWRPFFGTCFIYVGVRREDVFDKFGEIVAKYGSFFRTWNGTTVGEVHLMKPDHIQTILRSSAHTTKGPFYQYLYSWLGDGLFISEGAKWFFQRKLLTPKFHFKILESFLPTFAEKAAHMVEALETKANGQYFDVSTDIYTCAFKIICETSMGVDLDDITDAPLNYVRTIHEITEAATWRYFRPYINDTIFNLLPQGRQFNRNVNESFEFCAKVVAHKKNLRQAAKAQVEGTQTARAEMEESKRSFLDLILDENEDKNAISDSDLKYLINTFIIAGFETTSTIANWILFLLGNHPEIQEKLFEEVREVLKDKDAPTTLSELKSMTYLECVIKETLRLYPVLPFVTRKVTEEVNINGYTVPVDTQAFIHIFLTHRDPDYWPHPDSFDPDRFTLENSKGRHPFAYIPFSAGPRNCIGQRFSMFEEKVMISSIIKKYKVVSRETPEQKRLFAHVILRPQGGIRVKLERR